MTRLRLLVAACLLPLIASLSGVATAQAQTYTQALPQTKPQTKPHRPHVTWGATSFYPGTPLTAKGVVTGGKRTVQLQVRIPGRWKTLAATHSNRTGAFRISAALDWYGAHKVRVYAPGRHPFSRATRVTVATPYAPRGTKTDFKFLQGRGMHWTFNPCQPVRYKINADDVGPIGIYMAQVAMTQVSWATGVRVKYTGTTHVIPFQKKHTRMPGRTNMVLAWADETEVPDFVSRNAAGFGGPIQSISARNAHGKHVWMTRTAGVVLDDRWFFNGQYTQTFDAPSPTFGEIVVHEVGHAFGLDHVPSAQDEIMYPGDNLPWADGQHHSYYNAGDLAGLKKLGLSQGCVQKAPLRGRVAVRTGAVPPQA